MKKIIACISLVFAMSAGVTALAADADYVKDGNSYSGNISEGYTTVLIEKDAVGETPSEIVYVNQEGNGLGTAVNFLLKGDELADGDYTVTLGGSSTGQPIKSKFKVKKVPVNTPVTVMGQLVAEDGTSQIGCKARTTAANAAYLVVTAVNDGVTQTGYLETNFSGDGDLDLAIKITDIPKDTTVTVYLTDYIAE